MRSNQPSSQPQNFSIFIEQTTPLARLLQIFTRCLVLMSCLIFAGCQSLLYKPTGNVLVHYSQDEAVPYTLAVNDPALGCALGEAFSPFLLSFERTSVDVDRVGILMNTLSGYCAQAKAWDEELRQLRALKKQDSATAKDALTAQKRFLGLAAKRQYNGYLRLVTAFGEPGQFCPDFISDTDEFYYLIGLVNGLQAAQNNIAANQTADVPMSVVNKVARGAACLQSDKWWGVPEAMQAVVWSMLPGSAPENADPIASLRTASQLGLKQGVRLSHVFEAEVYNAASDRNGIKSVITEHANALKEQPADARLKLMDGIAFMYIQFLSDRIWTEDTGHRTPHGQFGRFWQPEKLPEEVLDIDDLI